MTFCCCRVFHPGGDVRGAEDGAVPAKEPLLGWLQGEEADGHRRARPLRAEGQPRQRASHTHATPLDFGKFLSANRGHQYYMTSAKFGNYPQ